MVVPFESPRTASGRRRLEELREKRRKSSIAEAMSRSRSMIIINLTVEFASAVIVLVGVAYLIRFFRMQRYTIDPLIFRISAACLGVFITGWLFFLFVRIRRHLLRLSEISRDDTDV